MGFQFPAAPTLGQVYNAAPGVQYTWNGTGWSPTTSVANVAEGLFPDGTMAAPAISWLNEPSAGFRRRSAGTFDYVIGGATTHTFSNLGLTVTGNLQAESVYAGASLYAVNRAFFANGTAAAPGISWASDTDSGWYFAPAGGGAGVPEMHASINGAPYFGVGATRLFSLTQHFFSDGTAANPGIAWLGQGGTGFARNASSGTIESYINGVMAWAWSGTSFYLAPAVTLNITNLSAVGAATISGNLTTSGASTFYGRTIVNKGGWDGVIGSWGSVPFNVEAPVGSYPCVGLLDNSVSRIWYVSSVNGSFMTGSNYATGPTALAGFAMKIHPDGGVFARSFSNTTFAATAIAPMTGALLDILKLRGVRCINSETGRPDIRVELDDVERAFPELVSEAGEGKSVNYAMLAAPMIEAIRELAERVTALEPFAARVKMIERRL